MKRTWILLCLFTGLVAVLHSLTVPATVVGAKVWVVEYQLKLAGSVPMANATVNAELDLTQGIGNTLNTPLVFDEIDADAAELSITFRNDYILVKAYADDGAGTFYYTTTGGVASTANDPATLPETDFDFLDLTEIWPPDADDRIVPQSPFPEPVYIAAGSSHTIHGRVNLEYAVMFYDGNDGPDGNGSWTSVVFPADVPTFALADLDVVLALDRQIESEVYLFAGSSAALTAESVLTTKAVAIFFDSDGNIHDGAAKTATGYNVNSTFTNLGSWKRFSGATLQMDDTIPFSIARNYDNTTSTYNYEYSTAGFTRSTDLEIGNEKTFTVDAGGGPVTIYYKRIE